MDLQNEQVQEQAREDRLAALQKLLPPDILSLSGFFPVAPNISPTADTEVDRLERLRSLYWYLPPADEAADLRTIYFQHAGASFSARPKPALTPFDLYSVAWMLVTDLLQVS